MMWSVRFDLLGEHVAPGKPTHADCPWEHRRLYVEVRAAEFERAAAEARLEWAASYASDEARMEALGTAYGRWRRWLDLWLEHCQVVEDWKASQAAGLVEGPEA